jgi:hypothetical protein
MEASVEMVTKAYDANKFNNVALSRFYLNVDEDRKTWGVGSGQDDAFFEGIMEFLRQRMINVNICNPFEYGGRTFDTQLEVVGYNKEGYMKIIEHAKIDDWDNTYRPLGYIVCKAPPQNYVTAYKLEKERFTKNYMANMSSATAKSTAILSIVWRDMSDGTKELIRSSIINGQDRDTTHLIRLGAGQQVEGLGLFDLPEKYVQTLVQTFKWRYFSKELAMAQRKKAENVIRKGIKKGNLREEWKDELLTPEEGQERMEAEQGEGIKNNSEIVKEKANGRRIDVDGLARGK